MLKDAALQALFGLYVYHYAFKEEIQHPVMFGRYFHSRYGWDYGKERSV
jgi:hypothetical protein